MARIAGVDLPKNKHLDRALTYIYGIGLTSAREILDKADKIIKEAEEKGDKLIEAAKAKAGEIK